MADIRDTCPQGVSSYEEWHGPYEVVRHPDTGRYFVVDNANRLASTLPVKGFAELEAAQRSRDAIDERRAGKERARALADHIFTTAMATLDPLGTPDSRRSEQAMAAAQLLLDTYADPTGICYDQDERPYYRVDASDGSGWFVVDFGYVNLHVRHVADPQQDQDLIVIDGGAPGSFMSPGSKPAGWNRGHTLAEVDAWVREVGEDYARNVPQIVAWSRRH